MYIMRCVRAGEARGAKGESRWKDAVGDGCCRVEEGFEEGEDDGRPALCTRCAGPGGRLREGDGWVAGGMAGMCDDDRDWEWPGGESGREEEGEWQACVQSLRV